MNDIIELLERINIAKKEISDNFQLWESNNKELLINTLKSICEYSENLFFDANEEITNRESYFLRFKNYSTPIYFETPTNIERYIEHGAYLGFSVTHKGNINVWMAFPHIENIIETEAFIEDISFIEQNDLSQTVIAENVSLFLREVWEYYLLYYREPSDYDQERTKIRFKNTLSDK